MKRSKIISIFGFVWLAISLVAVLNEFSEHWVMFYLGVAMLKFVVSDIVAAIEDK